MECDFILSICGTEINIDINHLGISSYRKSD